MKPGERLARRLICLEAFGVALAYALAVVVVDAGYVRRHVHDPGMAFGYAFCLVQTGIIALLVLCSLAIKFVRKRRDVRWERARPRILEKASAYLAGTDCAAELLAIRRRDPDAVEQCIAELLSRVQGAARTRLSRLAADLGLVEAWVRRYRSRSRSRRAAAIRRLGLLDGNAATGTLLRALSDSDDEIKLEASRALIRRNGPEETNAVFQTAVSESLLVRAVLVEALRPQARMLCQSALPAALANPDAAAVRTALQIVRAWGKVLPLDGVRPLAGHADPTVRAAALAVVPQLADAAGFEPEIRRGLADPDEGVRAAAAWAAGKLRLAATASDLERCLEGGGAEATVAAAYALARIGPEAWPRLDAQVRRGRSAAATASLEALEQAKSGRLALGTA